MSAPENRSIVATYADFENAEGAVRTLERGGIPMAKVSIVGRDWRVNRDVQGFYTPGDAAAEGATQGAWVGGLFGLLWGAGLFLFPVAGPVVVLGPLAGLIAGAIGGAGIGALISALVRMGVPEDEAIKYQSRLEAGQFLVVVHGDEAQVERARELLQPTTPAQIEIHHTPEASEPAA